MDDDDPVVGEYAKKYSPLITVAQAGEIAHAPSATIHGWSSAGLLDEFKVRAGRRILFRRDDFVRFLLRGGAGGTRAS